MAYANISILGVDNNSLPDIYIQTNFAQGQSSIGGSVYSALLWGNPIASGTLQANQDGYQVFGPNTVVTVQSASDAATLFGAGSPLHLMVVDFLRVNQGTEVDCIPVPLPASGNAATFVLTFAGPATSNGTVRVYVGAVPVDTSITNGDTATTIAANAAANINSNINLPVSATASTGVLTLAAKAIGARGNWLTAGAKLLAGTTGVTVNALNYVKQALFTGGTGSDNAGYTLCITTLLNQGIRYYYNVIEAGADSVDSTQVLNVQQNYVDVISQPTVGLRSVLFAGSTDTATNTESVTSGGSSPPTGGMNDVRVCVPWLNGSDVPAGRIATQVAAAVSLFQTPPLSSAGINFDNFGLTATTQFAWNLPAPLSGAAPSKATMKAAIMNGISPIKVLRGGNTAITKLVTTRCNNGVSFDFRIQDFGKVQIVDFFGDDLYNLLAVRYPNKLCAADPVQGQPPLGPNVVSPSQVAGTVTELIQTYAAAGLLNGAASIAGLIVQLNSANPSRIDINVPMFTGTPLHIFGVLLSQQS